ncbi:serine hydrolase domain-containing protein [Chitinophaga qingshengii]|uniref:Beta-lactamase family protein n=1 Tax=Chitinophaga qingshengii TaxID=1569794 RepID=A0ABR7TU02_9BACT|nr:serine hydrolase domain-containing protein [Chitinophaga qingshengii]MBC9933103.1 beta-lactamase family protein [Chitinophaga qingshengii]
MRYLSVAGSVILLLFHVTTVSAQIKTLNGKIIPAETMTQFLKAEIDSFHIPGLSIAFINNNKIVYHHALGYADIASARKVDDETLFESASMSKTVFAFFILKMAEKGVIALDTPLYTYLPNPDIAYDERYKLITARMVLEHTTGMPNWREYDLADSSLHIKKGMLYLKFKPGTAFSYSGEAYQYLTDVIAHLLHTNVIDLGDIVYREVCAPLGMKHAYFSWNDYLQQHRATGYRLQQDSINTPGELKKFEAFSAAGGLRTSALDYANFLIALLEEKGLKKSSFREMLKPGVYLTDTAMIAETGEAWGLGLAIKQTPYGVRYMHSGNNGDFTAYFVIYKEKKSGFVFLVNNSEAGELFEKLLPFFTDGDPGAGVSSK